MSVSGMGAETPARPTPSEQQSALTNPARNQGLPGTQVKRVYYRWHLYRQEEAAPSTCTTITAAPIPTTTDVFLSYFQKSRRWLRPPSHHCPTLPARRLRPNLSAAATNRTTQTPPSTAPTTLSGTTRTCPSPPHPSVETCPWVWREYGLPQLTKGGRQAVMVGWNRGPWIPCS